VHPVWHLQQHPSAGAAVATSLYRNSRRCWQGPAISTLQGTVVSVARVRVKVTTTSCQWQNPDVADIVVISPTELYDSARNLGDTNVLIWGRGQSPDRLHQHRVQHDLDSLKRKFAELCVPPDDTTLR